MNLRQLQTSEKRIDQEFYLDCLRSLQRMQKTFERLKVWKTNSEQAEIIQEEIEKTTYKLDAAPIDQRSKFFLSPGYRLEVLCDLDVNLPVHGDWVEEFQTWHETQQAAPEQVVKQWLEEKKAKV